MFSDEPIRETACDLEEDLMLGSGIRLVVSMIR